jgi:hypothetical protein
MKSKQLNEGLRPLDLADLVYPMFEVDTYRSKMGEDRDVCVVSFQVKDRSPANDLMEFVEKGYHFVLDADISSGENENGEYSVFVELNRSPKLAEEIRELTYGVRKLTGIEEFKFKYYKQTDTREVTEETLKSVIPSSPRDYDSVMMRFKTESIKRFFNKTLMDDLTLEGNVITIHKPFGQKVQLEMVKEDTTEAILETADSPIVIDEKATAETFWLTKVLGNYNINKIGDNFMFDNGGQAMILKRI